VHNKTSRKRGEEEKNPFLAGGIKSEQLFPVCGREGKSISSEKRRRREIKEKVHPSCEVREGILSGAFLRAEEYPPSYTPREEIKGGEKSLSSAKGGFQMTNKIHLHLSS